jgi:photosystem II PsbY protein
LENDDSFSMDARLLLVTAPILLAVAWAVFNIGRAAVGQLQLMLKRSRA